jgi:hypothetical protein
MQEVSILVASVGVRIAIVPLVIVLIVMVIPVVVVIRVKVQERAGQPAAAQGENVADYVENMRRAQEKQPRGEGRG